MNKNLEAYNQGYSDGENAGWYAKVETPEDYDKSQKRAYLNGFDAALSDRLS